MKMRVLGSILMVVAFAGGCANLEDDGQGGSPLVYGADDRLDWYQVTSPTALAQASATAGLFTSTKVTLRSDGSYQVATATTLATAQRVCSTEPYGAQPASAFCSGFLVAPDLLVTAGHCITSATSCASTTIAFGFRMDDASAVRAVLPASDVYRCAAIVGRAQTTTDDWAVIRLDRAVTGRAPVTLRRAGSVALGAPLVVMGHPSGIPLKVAGGATVRSTAQANYFEANLDTYGGNSGSPVFNATTGEVEGILVRGNTDYVLNASLGCYVSNTCPDTGCASGGWEDVTRTARFASLVPVVQNCSADGACNAACAANADPDCPAVPTAETSCTNGLDDDRDGRLDCADSDCAGNAACPSVRCGDGVCSVGESCDGRSGTTSCIGDCPGRTSGNTSRRYCYVSGVCTGRGCPRA
jgi:V8-like Glu-specific endopeptidase